MKSTEGGSYAEEKVTTLKSAMFLLRNYLVFVRLKQLGLQIGIVGFCGGQYLCHM